MMVDVLMAIGRHGTGPALALFITALAATYRWESSRPHAQRIGYHRASVLMDNADYVSNQGPR